MFCHGGLVLFFGQHGKIMGVLVFVAAWVAVLVSCTNSSSALCGRQGHFTGVHVARTHFGQCWHRGFCPRFQVWDTDLPPRVQH